MKSKRETAGEEIRHFLRQYARFFDSTVKACQESGEPMTSDETGTLLDVVGALEKAEKCLKIKL